ncbi:extracellular solute-binding protein [Streptomyces pathocidini]|uniref:extracellular solute-binding protein n=1 Tax=Streptomyces pathocidini TaxID=1650571 RepID=UPI0033E70A0E
MSSKNLNRRGFIGAAGAAGLAVAGTGALTGCSDSGAAPGHGAEASAELKLPTYAPAKVAPPDLPGDAAKGVDPGYLRYPKELVKSVPTPPGDGKPITALTETFTTPPPGMAGNAYWQELNKRLGSEFKMTVVVDDAQSTAYRAKFNAIVASGDIPDIVWIPPNQGLQQIPGLVAAKFADLTPLLSGNAVKKFPNLANFPAAAWKSGVIDGKIVGIPFPNPRIRQLYLANPEFWKPVGGLEFDSAEDFLAKGRELLDTKRKKYVLEPAYVNHVARFNEWYGGHNTWGLRDGKLVHMFESDEYFAAIEFALKCRRAQLFWPDLNIPMTTTLEKIQGGYLGAYVNSFTGLLSDAKQYDFPMETIRPFAAEAGAKPNVGLTWISSFTAINGSAGKKRVEMLLNVLNYLAAPFGTEERLFLDNGVEDVHYTRTRTGDTKFTTKGNAVALTTSQPLATMTTAPPYLYIPGEPDMTRNIHGWETELLEIGQANPTEGHFSDTFSNKGSSLTTDVYDRVMDIVAGRMPLSEYQDVVKKFRRNGGDKMRGEYEESLSKSKPKSK